MDDIAAIKKDITDIKARNSRVEQDKAWETSVSRKGLVAILTYIVVVLFFFAAKLENPFINALVPTLGFLLSTLSIDIAKKRWIHRHNGKTL